ncbi:MAG: helix-turn-helix transcriptional regulator [Bdellovibrionales bacterium]
MPSGRQIRAGRVLLDMGAAELARLVGVSRVTIQNIEHGVNKRPKIETMQKIVSAFDVAGLEFLSGDGVRRRMTEVTIFEGVDGFAKFHDLVYAHLFERGGEACVCGASSTQFSKYRTDAEMHRARMAQLAQQRKDFRMRILAEQGDKNLPNTGYASYRWLPRKYFPPVAFYSFGDYKAEITFGVDNPPLIVLVKSSAIAHSYNQFFDYAWGNALDVPQEILARQKP